MEKKLAAQWLADHGDELFGYALKRVKRREQAEDLVQETFIAAVQSYDSFESRSSVRTWLFAILKNKVMDYYRKLYRHEEVSIGEDDVLEALFKKDGHWKEAPGAWAKSPEEALASQEFYAALERCVEYLPEKQQLVFNFRDLDGLDGDDICKVMNISSSNLWVLTHRARHQLRDCLTSNWLGAQ